MPEMTTPLEIVGIVADYFGLKSSMLLGKCRTRRWLRERQIAMYLCHWFLADRLTLGQIGEPTGWPASTISTSYLRIEEAAGADQQLAETLREIESRIKAGRPYGPRNLDPFGNKAWRNLSDIPPVTARAFFYSTPFGRNVMDAVRYLLAMPDQRKAERQIRREYGTIVLREAVRIAAERRRRAAARPHNFTRSILRSE